jgi:hypothetical protein
MAMARAPLPARNGERATWASDIPHRKGDRPQLDDSAAGRRNQIASSALGVVRKQRRQTRVVDLMYHTRDRLGAAFLDPR